MPALHEIEGIGSVYAQKLQKAGVRGVAGLLKAGATPKGRASIAEKAGVSPVLILEWVNRADLFRIKGVGTQYSDLLENAGVDTVKELAQRKPDNLLAKMTAVNAQKKLVRQLPSLKAVSKWVEEAKLLPRGVEY